MHYKDEILNNLAEQANVAQFISFDPDLQQRYARIYGYTNNCKFRTLQESLKVILGQSSEQSVNIRSFDPHDPKSREFIYGIKDVVKLESELTRLSKQGLYTIVNETIDVTDGGVSGVILGDLIEFAPDDTPRCVEKPGTAALSRKLGLELLKIVYGFIPALDYASTVRVEFSIHPLRRGFQHSHTIIWELEEVGYSSTLADIRWPNRFSQFLGDKAYGLLIAHILGLSVPRTTVISRRIAPFQFGEDTCCTETWLRTCPTVQVPGKFTTTHGWTDPFKLMSLEDPDGSMISSVIAQQGIEALYSGALAVHEKTDTHDYEIIVEGIEGFGDQFMVGIKTPKSLPEGIINSVKALYKKVAPLLGPVRMEWVVDPQKAWVVQFHRGATKSSGQMIYPGEPSNYQPFEVIKGLEALRSLVSNIKGKNEGIVLIGDVGITSHFGDVLRRAEIPSKISAKV
jgi:hypothetical protein